MVSPWPPSTNAVTFSTDTFSSRAMKVRKRAESSTPAMPNTRWVGKPDFFQASCTMASSGLVTSTRMAARLRVTISLTTEPTISAFLNSRSSRVMPGLRARPAVMTTTFPAPTTVILGRAPILSPYRLQLRHVLDDGGAELRALHFLGALHQPREVVGDHLGLDRLLQAGDDPVRRVGPAHVAEHHLARQDHRPRVHLVLSRVFRRRAVGGLEQRVAGVVVDVGAGRDADTAHLRRERVGEQVTRQVAGRDHVELVRSGEDLLQEGVGDGVLDEDPALGRLAAALVPADRLVAELALGQRVAPLHEHALGVLLDIALVHQCHVLAVVLDRIPDRCPDQPFGPFL